ncbi:BRO family protein [Ectopseudomonas alcaliphila]|uniref:BRO family protein n=1 Tax=Ectopseudomonas alcaliphila TaxID=101564 RepID=UPI00277D6FB2|nr:MULTISPECIES: BRO family protein [Pseudomonas]MDP9940975.1 prophage antirepressor-like protein [Pseudomonas sp. 3400]MDR7013194.1 prophage antirepressor-like protein [Pseudomonas alcaliphila]
MTSPINPVFEDIRLTVRRAADGRFWFAAQTVCQALELADEEAALLLHCRPEGILFGNEETPQAMIDLENLLRLSLSSTSSRAERLRSWLCQVLLPHLFSSSSLPSYRQLSTAGKRLRVLKWHDDWWMSVNDVMQVFGARPELLAMNEDPCCS